MSADDPRVERLLDELLNSNLTPEQVCAESPDLLPIVRKRWRRIRRLGVDLDSLFGSQGDQPPGERELPQIPGYQVEAVLGRGGMGIIYRVRHVKLNRVVALKMLLSGEYAGAVELARFTREAQAIAALQHPNIVQIYDVGEVDGRAYFTMELVGGGSLRQKLEGTPQPAQYCASTIEMLARAIHAAHVAGIVHRDLKPGNILLTPEGTPKISDFGLARHFEGQSDVTLDMAKVGTPSYMAPEQVIGKPGSVGPSADIYALGATLYELLTGRPPFRGETATETERQLLTREPVRPSQLNAKVPRDLETICLKCLQKEPNRRYESAAALADDLRRFAEGRPIDARPVGRAERSWRWSKRNPMAAALLLTALALVCLASAGGAWFVQQRSRHSADLRSEVATSVSQAVSFRKEFHFHEARELLERARQRLEPAGPDELRRLVDKNRADLSLAERLDITRAQAAALDGAKDGRTRAESLYAAAFADARVGREGEDAEHIGAAIRDSALRADLVAALDDWASITPDDSRRRWLLAVARGADPDPVRDRLRQPELWQNKDPLTSLARELKLAEVSPQLATALGRVSRLNGGDAVPLLRAVQAHFPQDFWLNLELGWSLHLGGRSPEAVGYYRAALSLRPDTPAAHNGLGMSLYATGQREEAADHYWQAFRLDPRNAASLNNVGIVLMEKGQRDEAFAYFRQALEIDPEVAGIHSNLGLAMRMKGWHDQAIDQFREAIRLEPKPSFRVRVFLAESLQARGRTEEAIDQLRQAVQLDRKSVGVVLADALYADASAAVQAAADQGSDKEQRDGFARAALHHRALDRLRENLQLTKELLAEGRVPRPLANWQTDPAFTSVRDRAELAKLPDAEREQWQSLWADVAALVDADPLEQGRAHATRGHWDRAAVGYTRSLVRAPTDDGHFWFEYAALSLLSGDRSGYTTACSHLVEAFGNAGGPRAYHIARACTLAPDAVKDPSLPARLAVTELQSGAKEFWSLTEQGALAFRAGRFEEAVPLFEQSLQANSKPGAVVVNWLWLALAKQRLGKSDEARRWLNMAQTWLDEYREGTPPRAAQELGLDLHNWLEANVLRRQAEAMIPSTTSTAPNR